MFQEMIKAVLQEEDIYTIESLVAKKGSKYLVKWENFPHDQNTWEPRSAIPPFIVKVNDALKLKVQIFDNKRFIFSFTSRICPGWVGRCPPRPPPGPSTSPPWTASTRSATPATRGTTTGGRRWGSGCQAQAVSAISWVCGWLWIGWSLMSVSQLKDRYIIGDLQRHIVCIFQNSTFILAKRWWTGFMKCSIKLKLPFSWRLARVCLVNTITGEICPLQPPRPLNKYFCTFHLLLSDVYHEKFFSG